MNLEHWRRFAATVFWLAVGTGAGIVLTVMMIGIVKAFANG